MACLPIILKRDREKLCDVLERETSTFKNLRVDSRVVFDSCAGIVMSNVSDDGENRKQGPSCGIIVRNRSGRSGCGHRSLASSNE